ncbi:unnamed protein product [Rotaria sp. Silwood2]|nr:unnamed protein product [Rotaria sp. Silwood2]
MVVAGIGCSGSIPNVLDHLYGVFVDNKLNLYVADTGNNRTQLFTPGRKNMKTIANFAAKIRFILNTSTDIALDADGYLYIVESQSHQIIRQFPMESNVRLDVLFCFIPVPLRASMVDFHPNATWAKNGITVAGENGQGSGTNQVNNLWGLYVEDDQTIYVTDRNNCRIVEWKPGATNGTEAAGGNEPGNGAHQLNEPYDVFIINRESNNLIISDFENRRVVRWPCHNETMKRYKIDDIQGTVVADENGIGNRLDQLNYPSFVFIDRDHSAYVSDNGNHRVMKYARGAKQDFVVAGGQRKRNSFSQLSERVRVVVDQLGTVYVTERLNHRIIRWPKGATQGSVIIDGNDQEAQLNQLDNPVSLSFDRHDNLYVVDNCNHRVQKFIIK